MAGRRARDVEMNAGLLPDGAAEAPAPPARDSLPPTEMPGSLGPLQCSSEKMSNDPDWPPGCWLSSYMVMHRKLIAKARAINAEHTQQQDVQQQATGQNDVTIASSMQLLRREVFSLCPMEMLGSGMAISVVLTILTFCVPYVQGRLVDVAVDAGRRKAAGEAVDEWSELLPQVTLVGVFMFTSYWCEILVGILFAVSGHTTVTRLRIKLFRNLTIQDIAFYDAHVSGELSSRLINDSASLSSLTQFTTQTLLGAVVKFCGSLVAMYCTHPGLALIATVITPLNTFFVKRTGMVVGHYGTVQNAAMAKANACAIEVLGNVRTVQSNVGETQEAFRFMERLNYFLRVIKGTVYLETVLRFTQYGLSKMRDVIVLAVGMHQVINGGLSIGQYTAFSQYIGLYEDGFKNLSDIWINFKQTITSTGKFVQLLKREPVINPDEMGEEPAACMGAISFQNVHFTYQQRPDDPVLTDFNLEARPGQVIALVGESGAGKSTVGRLLLRFYDPTRGRILLDGKDFCGLRLWWLRSQIGVVEQEPVLFDRPLADNIAYGSALGRSREEIESAARIANAHEFISLLPGTYDSNPGERAARISGGQKQRVAIARAVIREPKVLLLDEATSALDSANESQVQAALEKLMSAKKATTFVIAHRLSTVKSADCILVLHRGTVVEQGTHQQLLDLQGHYARFMQHQLVGTDGGGIGGGACDDDGPPAAAVPLPP